MSHPTVSEPLFQKSTATRSCLYCGAQFQLLLAHSPDGDDSFDCECPECGKTYDVQAALRPDVRLLSPRTDGKNDRYQETMF